MRALPLSSHTQVPRHVRVVSGSLLSKPIVPPQVMSMWERASLLDLKLVIAKVLVGYVRQKWLVHIRFDAQVADTN